MPELNTPILDGSADDDFLVDLPAGEGFGPEADVTPELFPEDSPSFDPEDEDDKPSLDLEDNTLPNTGGVDTNSILAFGTILTTLGTTLLRKKKYYQ